MRLPKYALPFCSVAPKFQPGVNIGLATYHPWFNDPSNPAGNEMNPTAGAIATARHGGGANYVFADGHAGWKRYGQTLAPVNRHVPEP